jgi:hypothetical protein
MVSDLFRLKILSVSVFKVDPYIYLCFQKNTFRGSYPTCMVNFFPSCEYESQIGKNRHVMQKVEDISEIY